MEVFKTIKGFERYSVSNQGRVINSETGKVLSQRKASNGYLRVNLRKGNIKYEKPHVASVHRLVAEAFLERIPGKDYVNHKDLNKENNNVKNLEWCTAKENSQHVYLNDADYRKKCKANLKVSHERAKQKIAVYKNGALVGEFLGKKEVSDFLGIDEKTVYNGLRGMVNRKGYNFQLIKGVV